MDTNRVRFVIEVEPGPPVCGSLAREGGVRHSFEGMLGFLSVFELLLAGDRPAESEQRTPRRLGSQLDGHHNEDE